MKKRFVSILLTGTLLAMGPFPPGALQTAIAADKETRRPGMQEPASRIIARSRSPLFEALSARARGDAAHARGDAAGTGDGAGPGAAWDRERAFAEMERLRAEIVTLTGLGAAQKELLQWNRERLKTGAAPAALPALLCREAEIGAWCSLLPATFGARRGAPGNPQAKDESR